MCRLALGPLVLLLSSAACAGSPGITTTSIAGCAERRHGPAVMHDLQLYREGHPGTRVIDYGQRVLPGEFERPLGIECRVLHDTAPVAQWIARPPPKGQVAGSIPARGVNIIN